MALGTIVLKIGEAEVGTYSHDLPEGVVATTERDGQTLTVTLAVPAPPKRVRAAKKSVAKK